MHTMFKYVVIWYTEEISLSPGTLAEGPQNTKHAPAHSFLCTYLRWRDQSVRHEHSGVWQDREVCFTDI